MYPSEVTENGNCGHILAVESENAGRLLAETGRALRWRNLSVEVLMLAVIRSRDLGQQASHHFYDIRDRHFADLVLRADFIWIFSRAPRGACLGKRTGLIGSKALYVRKALDLYPLWRCSDPRRGLSR